MRTKHREFIYVGDPVPQIHEQEHAAFLLHVQQSILVSLEKRNLLTHSQYERCNETLEEQHSRKRVGINDCKEGNSHHEQI